MQGEREAPGAVVLLPSPPPPTIYRRRGGGCAPSRVPTPGGRQPYMGWRGSQEGERGGRALGWALGPSAPRVSPFPLQAAPWALVGGAPAHSGVGPFPLLAHASLRGWWPLPVDPWNPSGGPGTLPMMPGTLPVAKSTLPIYQSLPPDHSGTPHDVRDLIRDSEQHSVTAYILSL